MDFPIFFLDFFGNRILIAVVASVHVFINHPLAVGAYPLVVLMEWWGRKTGNPDWDRLAYRITFVLFIVTTSLGALTGVGIWLTTALIAPFGIGSLLRVFFWGWFLEWLVFIGEVVLVLIYFLTWKRWSEGNSKKLHVAVGVVLAVFSWLTMAVITGILGFMMSSGKWPVDKSLISAFLNPIYLPQLAFRTTCAMMLAGLCAWFLIFFFARKQSDLRRKAIRLVSVWIIVWVPLFIAGAFWYWKVVPDYMLANINVALLTQKFMHWHQTLAWIIIAVVIVVILTALAGLIRPRIIPRVALIIPFVLGLWLLGHFERVREFIRKPFIIEDYMYSNGVRVSELPIYQRDGILPYCTFVSHRQITSGNMVEAGRDVFLVTCSRCHTTTGINGIIAKFENLYGRDEWDDNAMQAFVESMHTTRTYMPPFPGNEREAEALITYFNWLRETRQHIFGAQNEWTVSGSEEQVQVEGGR